MPYTVKGHQGTARDGRDYTGRFTKKPTRVPTAERIAAIEFALVNLHKQLARDLEAKDAYGTGLRSQAIQQMASELEALRETGRGGR